MTELSLAELETERDQLYAQLGAVGDFRRGSVSENYRRCGRPNCACAAGSSRARAAVLVDADGARPEDQGHQLAPSEVAEVRRELERFAEFAAISEQIVEVSEKICKARPVSGTDTPSAPGVKKGLWAALTAEASAEIGRLAADRGYRGPCVACGNGHQAKFTAYRDKVIGTVLGPVTLTRAWYHCAACGTA